jgi:cysteine desulfurase/selenocysteine lyase
MMSCSSGCDARAGLLDPLALRPDFPALTRQYKGRPVVYLDNACMTLKPEAVLRAEAEHGRVSPGCHGRTDHLFGLAATNAYDEARADLARFIGAREPGEVIFTRNTTEGINLIAAGLGMKEGDVVVASGLEHNSNLLPWQILAERSGVGHEVVPVRPDTTFDLEAYENVLRSKRVRLVSVLHTSNLSGVTFPVERIAELAHRHGALVLLDAAQAALTHRLDVQAWGADFLALSAHKMLGPTGMGLLFIRKELQGRVRPLLSGGETVTDTTYRSRTMAAGPDRFEAGLQNYAGAAGAAAAARYVAGLGPENILAHVVSLNEAFSSSLLSHRKARLIGPSEAARRGGICNFTIDGADSYAVAKALNRNGGIMVRAGKHCVHSWYHATGTADSVRVSFGPYNTKDEVERLLPALRRWLR